MSQTVRGILLMLAAMACFSVMDAMSKILSETLHPMQAVWARYTGQTLIVGALVAPRLVSVLSTAHPGPQLLRSTFLFAATCFFFTALAHMPIAAATAVMLTNPVMLTLGAALILGEPLGWRRVAGVAVALAGALIIIRPGGAVFSPHAVLPLLAGLSYAAYALTTRFLRHGESVWTSFLHATLVGTVFSSIIVTRFWETPDSREWAVIAALVAAGAAGQFCVIRALMLAEAGIIAPFSYTGLLWAALWGVLLFDEIPDSATGAGALVIAAAGLYVLHREVRARDATPDSP